MFLGEVKLWDIAMGKARATFAAHLGMIRQIIQSPDGKTLALRHYPEHDSNAEVMLLDVATGRQHVFPPQRWIIFNPSCSGPMADFSSSET